MLKLKKEEFDNKYRFRESRGEINCASCEDMDGKADGKEYAFCVNEKRLRKRRLTEYLEGYFGRHGTNKDVSFMRVCDDYKNKPLPVGIEKIILPEEHIIILGSQSKDIDHADINCPYVIEELRKVNLLSQEESKSNSPLAYLTQPGIHIRNISDRVSEETIGNQICEMPCCESKLPYHTWRVDSYRRKVGIKPDGTEPKPWVRNDKIKHEIKVSMIPEKAEIFFDLEKFNSTELGVHNKIIAANDYLHESCNRLGSRPLSEAVNPVWSDYSYHILKDSLVGPESNADFWIYHEKLFDIKRGLEKPIKDLEKIPEGLIPCIDSKGIFKSATSHCDKGYGRFSVYGIVREMKDGNFLSKGVNYFIEVGALDFHNSDHWWGVFGKNFSHVARFDEQ